MTAPRDVVVIGGGHNGLVAAAYLARAGLDVVVLERRDRPGGPADTVEVTPGFRAPVAHTVGRLRASVVRDLRLQDHGLRLIRPDVAAFVAAAQGGLTLWADPARTAGELRRHSPADAEAYPRFDRKVRALASFVANLHAITPPDPGTRSLRDAAAGLGLVRRFRRLGGPPNRRETVRVLPMAVADFVAEHLEDDRLRAAVAARGVQYTAMGPWSAGTTAVLLSDSVGGGGAAGQATTAVGGSGAVARALAGAARSLGAEVRCGAEVQAVLTDRDAATGVALAGGQEIAARAVVSSADPKRTLLHLVDPEILGPVLSWRVGNLRAPGTVAKVHLALDALPTFGVEGPDRLRGRIVVTSGIDDLERAFDASKYGKISEAPYVEATIPSLADPSLAPEGSHVLSALAQWAPYDLGDGGWDQRREELGDLVLKRLEEASPGLAGMIRARTVLTPLDLERDYALTEGHPLHLEPGLDQFFAWRPMLGMARYRTPIRNLYLCGSGSHPGGGITGAPGSNAAREILRDLKRSR